MWIRRDIHKKIEHNSDPIQVIRGPRQCGKSSLLLRLDSDFQEVSLDDPSLRELAQSDPELFLKQFSSEKLFIDEAQYAPALFPSLKRRADLLKRTSGRKTLFRLTGSNQILMDRGVKESLAGRASFFDMNTLSVAEILAARPTAIQEILYTGGWPELHAKPGRDPRKFLDDYINSYVEKDVVLAAGIQKSREFLKVVRLLAGRVGQLLDFAGLSGDAGVDAKTVKDWVSVLERMHLIALVPPFSSNLSSRLIKSPKVYFIDTGLACRLQGWTSAQPIMTSPQQGALFENLVFSELFKLNLNYQLGWQIHHWRSRDGEEVDFLIEKDPKTFLFIEAKVSAAQAKDPAELPEVRKVFGKKTPPLAVCHQEGERVLGDRVPIAFLKEFLGFGRGACADDHG
jgi:predicted AAA+ superfamily ATPase